jgi:hypothetical protein
VVCLEKVGGRGEMQALIQDALPLCVTNKKMLLGCHSDVGNFCLLIVGLIRILITDVLHKLRVKHTRMSCRTCALVGLLVTCTYNTLSSQSPVTHSNSRI